MSTKTKSKTNIRPLGDRVVVQRVEAEEKTAGGILLPDSAKDKPREGKVVAIGTGKQLDDGSRSTFDVKVGDRVLFTSYAGNEVKSLGTEYLIMREDDILGIVEE
jgi:chaperonin GroES